MVLGSVLPDEVEPAIKNNITLTLASDELLRAVSKKAKDFKKTAKVHVKVDTGMGRIGLWHEDEAVSFVDKAASSKCINVEGVYTHFSSAARDKVY